MPADLGQIIITVRQLTRSPSANLLSDNDIINAVNTFVLYDFPEELRLFELRTTLTWYCLPYIDEYVTDGTQVDVPQLTNFDDNYITTHYPIYSAGYKMMFSQKPEEFFNVWQPGDFITRIGTGDGINTNFVGTLSAIPVLRNNVTFSSITNFDIGLSVYDDGNGNLVGDVGAGPNFINYVHGNFGFNYSAPPGENIAINAMTFPYQPSRPTSILYYDDTFTLRPVPDQPYPINMEVYIRPSALLLNGQEPKLQQHWQYIAYGAAIKIFQYRSDLDSAAALMPEFEKQKLLVQRRTWVQYSNEQTNSIYKNQLSDTNFYNGNFGNIYW